MKVCTIFINQKVQEEVERRLNIFEDV